MRKRIPQTRAHQKKTHIREKRVASVDNRRDIALILQKNKLLQDILGFSAENMSGLFQDGLQFLQMHSYDDALKIFSLLVRMNPYVADFWVAQGLVYQVKEEYKTALSSFLVAQTMDPARFEGYLNAIECCISLGDYAQAQAIIRQGLRFAKTHPKIEGLRPFLEEIHYMQERIINENS